MDKKVLLATLAGGIVNFVLGWVVYGMLLQGFSAANAGSASGVERIPEEMAMHWIFVGCVAHALLLTLVFSRWTVISTFKGGATAGAWMGFLLSLGYYMVNLGTTHLFNLTAALTFPAVDAVTSAIMGGVIGWVLGYAQRS